MQDPSHLFLATMPRGGMDPEIALLSEEERLDPDDARELLDLDGER